MARRRVSPAAGFRLRDELHRNRLARAAERPAPVCAFEYDAHRYTIDGVQVPSVTQVLTDNRLIDFSTVPPGILDEAQYRGTYIHRFLHAYLERDIEIAECAEPYRGYLDSALAYLADVRKTPLITKDNGIIGVEWRFWDTERRYAGTVDFVGYDADNVVSLDDWKTGSPMDVSARLQLAAYEFAVRKYLVPTLAPIYHGPVRRRAVKLYADGKIAKAEPYEDPRDLSMFLSALSLTHYRRNGLRHQDYSAA
jgi:hypothetical protein